MHWDALEQDNYSTEMNEETIIFIRRVAMISQRVRGKCSFSRFRTSQEILFLVGKSEGLTKSK